jgi:hypothetical protein
MQFPPLAVPIRRSQSPQRSILLRAASLLLFVSACCASGLLAAQQAPPSSPWDSIVREFATKIVAAGSVRGEGSLEVRNLSSLDAPTAAEIHASLLGQLTSRGFRLIPDVADKGGPASPPTAPIHIVVTLSENLDGLIWIAELHTSSGNKIAMLPVAPPPGVSANEAHPVPLLERTVFWRQGEPMLDFAIVPATGDLAALLIVLSPERVTFYRSEQGVWHIMASAAIEHTQPWPRDLRGRMELDSGKLSVYLPGTFCSGTAGTELGLYCSPGADKLWPVGAGGIGGVTAKFDPARNYFLDPVENPSAGVANFKPFYSVARVQSGMYGGLLEVVAGPDGAQLHEGREIAAHFPGWGGDIASLDDTCAAFSPVLVTGAGDDTSTDTIQIYQMADRQAVAAGQPVLFPGPVRALWDSSDAKSARVVSQNLQTGMYEASSISISCGR